ncbi:TetR/AcrR family transcriptional regulator [Longispora albida]|uniref:TetR/AcrR family transcriptional regulator n=1 Tax=Longispora albida TaxID=203523 RepID=UPI001FDFE4E2|nr:TetR/AcrR family transcriptional regulator C-terminal domain-containing protein [Longispora albida]
MPRPRSLTPAALAAAALAVLDREGLPGLTMRSVATELHMSTMALYRYVPDRSALERLVVDLVVSGTDLGLPAGLPWREQLAVLTGRIRTQIGAHPAVVPLLLSHRHTSPGTLAWGDAVLAVLAGAGFGARARVIAFRALLAYLLGALQAGHLGPLSGSGTGVMAGLSGTYPHLAATARAAQAITAGEEFDGGLAIVLRGLSPDS